MSYEDLDADVARETDDASRHINITLHQSTKNEGQNMVDFALVIEVSGLGGCPGSILLVGEPVVLE